MTVETSPADDSTVRGGAEGLELDAAIAAGEAVLAHRFGSAITLVDPEDLAGSGPATVVRARVASSPFALPRTLVIKHYPRLHEGDEADPFAQEAVSYQLFTALAAEERMCPELLAHDGERRVLVIEDLGRAPTLEDKLSGSDARGAERALLSWARSLGRLHASTAGREADFNALLRRLGGPVIAEDSRATLACAQLPALLEDVLGVEVPDAVRSRADAAADETNSVTHRAFTPVDLLPDNNLVTSTGVRFLDFERGRMRNVLVDAATLRLPFIRSEHVRALPAGMSEAMVAAWRAEVSAIWPSLSDDEALASSLLDGQLLLAWLITWQALPGMRDEHGTTPGSRAGALVYAWSDLARCAALAGESALAEHAEAVVAALNERYGPGLDLPYYPAFR